MYVFLPFNTYLSKPPPTNKGRINCSKNSLFLVLLSHGEVSDDISRKAQTIT